LTDAQFSVRGLVNATTGRVVERVAYDAYGVGRHSFPSDTDGDLDVNADGVIDGGDYTVLGVNPGTTIFASALPAGRISSGGGGSGTPDNDVGYCGYVFNHETQDYHVRFRAYAPRWGRWLQRDPLVYPDGMNSLQYGISSPTVHEDPFGLAPPPKVEFELIGEGAQRKVRVKKTIYTDSLLCSLSCGFLGSVNEEEVPEQEYLWDQQIPELGITVEELYHLVERNKPAEGGAEEAQMMGETYHDLVQRGLQELKDEIGGNIATAGAGAGMKAALLASAAMGKVAKGIAAARRAKQLTAANDKYSLDEMCKNMGESYDIVRKMKKTPHHVIGAFAKGLEELRSRLRSYGVSINAKENGIILDRRFHEQGGINTNSYRDSVKARLDATKTKKAFLAELEAIKEDLLDMQAKWLKDNPGPCPATEACSK
jgi:RHS repeat-associated protein